MSSVAVLALARFESERPRAVKGAQWLLVEKSQPLPWLHRFLATFFPKLDPVELDSTLEGWSWVSGTTAWVEPTAHALTALKALSPFLPRRQTAERIQQGELVLEDRMCVGGGWNAGNKTVMGVNAPPYPDTTALALLALQGTPVNDQIRSSLTALREMLGGTRTGLVLALSTLCFQLYGQDVSSLRAELRDHFRETQFGGEVRPIALALLALDEREEHFKVARNG